MKRICRLCKKFVACEHGLCPSCYNKLPEQQKKDMEIQMQEKRGTYTCTLDTFK